jgi:hypothetical protein
MRISGLQPKVTSLVLDRHISGSRFNLCHGAVQSDGEEIKLTVYSSSYSFPLFRIRPIGLLRFRINSEIMNS